MPGEPPSKKEQLLKLLDRGSVFVHLDPRRDGVEVPEWLSHKPQLVLQLGRNFAIPIPDLEIDEAGVRCTLSFNRSPFHCVLPWSAVYALVAENGEVTVWPSELPAELVPEAAAVRRTPPVPRSARPKAQRPRISVVPQPGDESADDESAEPAAPAKPASLPPPALLAEVPAAPEATPSSSRDVRANDSGSIAPRPLTPAQPLNPAQPAAADDVKKPQRPPYLRLVK